jgi:DNA (cytosine-5)-methyltransferase 1
VKPRLLDLFCGEGGAAAGYVAAGFEVVGVDSNSKVKQRYLESGASAFFCADANDYPLDGFDAVHASPPCQDHSTLSSMSGTHGTGWMLAETIERLTSWGGLWVVENVAGADMPGSLVLCGSEFGLQAAGRILRRHRRFVSSTFLMGAGGCDCAGRPTGGVYGNGGGGQMTRGYKFNAADSREAMEMTWASRHGVSQAIPPAYAEFIGEQLLPHLAVTA